MLKLKETARRIWRHFEAIAHAADHDPLTEIALRVERLERVVAELGKASERSARNWADRTPRGGSTRDDADPSP